MIGWLASRKSLPEGTRAWLAERGNKARAGVLAKAADNDLAQGAPEALKRLAAAEASDYAALQAAIASGDASEIKLAHGRWLKTGDSLRRYDLMVEKSRRDAGELQKRSDVEEWLRWLGRWWRWCVTEQADNTAMSLVGETNPAVIRRTLTATYDDNFLTSLAAVCARWKTSWPEWAKQALLTAQVAGYRDADAAVVEGEEKFRELFGKAIAGQ